MVASKGSVPPKLEDELNEDELDELELENIDELDDALELDAAPTPTAMPDDASSPPPQPVNTTAISNAEKFRQCDRDEMLSERSGDVVRTDWYSDFLLWRFTTHPTIHLRFVP